MKGCTEAQILEELIGKVEAIAEELNPFQERVGPDGKFSEDDQNRLTEIENRYESIVKEAEEKLPNEDLLEGPGPYRFSPGVTEIFRPDWDWFGQFKSSVEKGLENLKGYLEALLKHLEGTTGKGDD